MQIPGIPRRSFSADRSGHPKSLPAVSSPKTERQCALAFELVWVELVSVVAQGQGGWLAGSSQQNRCQVLPSSLLSRWQHSGKPAIPPWFTSGDSPLASLRLAPFERSVSAGIARSTGAHPLRGYQLHGKRDEMDRPKRRRRRFPTETVGDVPFARDRQKGILPVNRAKPIRWESRKTFRLGPDAATTLRRVHSD
jgi:hypothetical protein